MKTLSIGQVSPTRFVHRAYEEQGVRITLATFFDPDDTDRVGGYAVQTERDGVCSSYAAINANVFGPGTGKFAEAAEEFKQRVANFIGKGAL
jgi:hypothetical protein